MKRRDFLQGSLAGALLVPAQAATRSASGPASSPAAPWGDRTTHTSLETDLLVVGGGMAGVCTALAAARQGGRVVLVQDRSVLGGNASSEVKMHIVGASVRRLGARESGLIEELRLEDAARNPQRCYPLWDLLLYEKVKREPNITLLLDTDCVGCSVETGADGRRITSARAMRNMTEEVFTISATYFADCSGDSRLALEAGAEFTVGREDKLAYLEDLARDEADKQTLGSSILMTARKHDQPMPFIAPDWIRKFEKKDFARRGISTASYEYGFWWAEWGGQLDTIKDNDRIRHELLRIALGIWDYIKNSGDHPNSAHWALDWIGAIPGKRESRRLFGDHVLNQDEVMNGQVFPDQVAYGGWPIDLHPPSGIDKIEERPANQIYLKQLYSIPLRCLYSRNVANLFMAGRNISASHVAFGSTRVMATCATMGQAVGTAVAYALAHQRRTRTVLKNRQLAEPAHCEVIQQWLLRDDAYLLGLRNEDAADLARQARVTASSAVEEPAQVLDGCSRRQKAEWGSWSDELAHCWQSRELPAWIQLSWDAEHTIREIHLTFDSGFERALMLTCLDRITATTIRAPQPETVRDYTLLLDGRAIVEVKGNYLRKRVHRLESPLRGRELRLQIAATNGAPDARVFEIRAYA